MGKTYLRTKWTSYLGEVRPIWANWIQNMTMLDCSLTGTSSYVAARTECTCHILTSDAIFSVEYMDCDNNLTSAIATNVAGTWTLDFCGLYYIVKSGTIKGQNTQNLCTLVGGSWSCPV